MLPFIVSRRRRWGPLRATSAGLLGGDPAITEIRVPLIDVGHEHLAVQAARDDLARSYSWDWINWSGMRGEYADAVQCAGGTVQRQSAVQDMVLDLPSSWEEFRGRLRRNIRELLRHVYSSLRRDGHRFAV